MAWMRPLPVFVLGTLPYYLFVSVEAKKRKEETSTGCPATLPRTGEQRSDEFVRIHKRWPPQYSYPGKNVMKETPGWTKYMTEKEGNLSLIEDHTWKWERWLEQVQIRLLKNFTAKGWGIGQVPSSLHQKILDDFRQKHDKGNGVFDEGSVAGYIGGRRSMVSMEAELRKELSKNVQDQVAKWASVDPKSIEATSLYGIRTYYRNSTLETHVDRCESHILSCVYVVDYHYDSDTPGSNTEPWYMVTDPDLSGERAAVQVKPGQLFFYESAKLPHGRPSVLHGDYSAHIFIHFAPKDWNFHNMDRVYGLPLDWDREPAESEGKAHKTLDVHFVNDLKDGLTLYWIPQDERAAVPMQQQWSFGTSSKHSTYNGHVFEVRDGENLVKRWKITPDLHGHVLSLVNEEPSEL